MKWSNKNRKDRTSSFYTHLTSSFYPDFDFLVRIDNRFFLDFVKILKLLMLIKSSKTKFLKQKRSSLVCRERSCDIKYMLIKKIQNNFEDQIGFGKEGYFFGSF